MGLRINELDAVQRRKALDLDKRDKQNTQTKSGPNKKTQKLMRRFNQVQRSWLEKWQRLYSPAKLLSLVCNVVSGSGVFYLVAMAFEAIPYEYANYAIAATALGGFEWIKREASDSFWDDYWSSGRMIDWARLAVNVALMVFSMAASVFGVYHLVTETDAGAAQMNFSQKPEAAALIASVAEKNDRIAEIEAEVKKARADKSNYNSQGIFYYKMQGKEAKAQDRIAALESSIAATELRLANEFDVINIQNRDTVTAWEERMATKVGFVLFTCLLFEILFEVCMGFLSRYDFKALQLEMAINP